MADGNHIEVAKAYVTIVPSLEGSQGEISKQISKETEGVEKEGEKSGKSLGEGLAKGLKATAGIIAGALTAATASAVALGKKFIDAAKATAEVGDTIDKQAQKVGFSNKAWQEWDYVLKLAGSSMQTATAGIKTMTNQVSAATSGNKEAIANFKQLGISVKDLKNMSREEIFGKIIEQLQKMPEGTKRAALANKLLGKSGQELTPIFNQSADATKNLIKQANDYGIILDDKAVKSSVNFKDSLTTLKATVEGLKNSLISKFLPSLTSIADGLAMVFGSKNDADRQAGIKTIEYGMRDLAEKLTTIAPAFFEAAGKILKALVEGIAPALPAVIEALFSVVSQAIQTIVGMLPQLMPAIISGVKALITLLIQVLPILIDGVMKLITALAQWLGTPENAQLIANGIVSLITSLAKTISETLPILLPAIVTLITEIAKCLTQPDNLKLVLQAVWEIIKAIGTALINSIPILLEAIGTIIGNLFTAAVEGVAAIFEKLVPMVSDFIEFWVNKFKEGWKMFTDAISNAGTAIVNFFTGIGEKIAGFFSDIWEKVTGFFSTVKNAITGFFTNVKNGITNAFNNVKNAVSGFFTNIKNFFTDGFNAIKNGISDMLGKVKGFFSDMLNGLKELPHKAIEAGKNIVNGIINGVKSMIKNAVDAVKNLGKNMLDGIKGFFKIKSPSRVMRDVVGKNLALGIGEGFTEAWNDVDGEINDTMKGFTANMSAEVTADGQTTGAELAKGGTINNNSGSITLNIYGAEGQNVNDLAEIIAVKLQDMTARKGAVFA